MTIRQTSNKMMAQLNVCVLTQMLFPLPFSLSLSPFFLLCTDILYSYDDGVTFRLLTPVGIVWNGRWGFAMWSYGGVLTLAFGAIGVTTGSSRTGQLKKQREI